VLTELNEALLREKLGYRFCTVLYASLMPHDGGVSVCMATGGHPLPLVVRTDGTVETVGRPGSLLGILQDAEITEQAVELGPGDAFVLVTDGVTEATPADRASGPGRLLALLAGYAGAGAAAIADAVERDALEVQGGVTRDDVAVLVARVPVGGEPFASGMAGVAAAT
jgi:serine phosphatase RsbU (regulator of sigma subunit)